MTSIILPSNATDPSQITSETLPTTRADGSPLQVGDRWYKSSTSTEGFWNGTLWLSAPESLRLGGSTNLANGILHSPGEPNIYEILDNTFIESIQYWFRATVGGTYNELNYWRVAPVIEITRGLGESQLNVGSISSFINITAASIVNNMAVVTRPINTLYTTRYYLDNFRCNTQSVGAPSAMTWIGGKVVFRRGLS